MRFSRLLFSVTVTASTAIGCSAPISNRHNPKSWNGPACFKQNLGVQPRDIKYIADGVAYSLELTDNAIVMAFPEGEPLRMELPSATLHGLETCGRAIDAPSFARVRYESSFPGVDLDVYWRQGEVEYDWIVEPGADPSVIRFSFTGARLISVDTNGDLVIETRTGYARHRRPRIYQEVHGIRHEVAGGFRLDGNHTVHFQIADYDRGLALVIDPQLVWGARFGGYIRYDQGTLHTLLIDFASGVTVDRAGNTYVTGTAVSGQLPMVHPLQGDCESNHCIFVMKIAPDGKSVVYSTYLGSVPPFAFQLYDGKAPIPSQIVSDPDGNVYLTGTTFRLRQVGGTTAQSAGGNDVFVVKIDPNGVLKATMLIGGSGDDRGTSISLGPDGYVYVAGITQSNDFPVSPNGYRTPAPGPAHYFTIKLDPKLFVGDIQLSQAAVYSAIFGGGSALRAPQIGADAMGDAYVAAYGDCQALNSTPNAVTTNCASNPLSAAGVVVKINPSGTKLLWVAMPTGSGTSTIGGLIVTPQGFTYIAGTTSSTDFPITAGAFNTTCKPASNSNCGFVAKLNPDGTAVVYASYLGPPGSTANVSAIALDPSGNAYIVGTTASAQFPTLNPIQSSLGNCCGGFLTVFKPDGSGLVWSTLLGATGGVDAVTLDAMSNVYVAGYNLNPTWRAFVFNYGETIDVMKIAPGGQPIAIDGIANAASFQPGLPMSGGLASMFVHGLNFSGTIQAAGLPLPLDLAGVSIFVDAVPAPILSITSLGTTGSQQINFQVPFEAVVQRFALRFGFSALSYSSVELRYNGLSSFGLPVTAPPGIFTMPDGSGAIQHASDYSLVTPQNPAVPGEVIIVYATGLGPVRPSVATGSAATGPAPITGYCQTPPTVNVGDVIYAGLTPGVPGLYQMNVHLLPNVASGTTEMHITWTDCQQIPSKAFPTLYISSTSNSVALPIQ